MTTAAKTPDRGLIITGKFFVGFLLLLLTIFAVIRTIDMLTGNPAESILFEARYFDHPVIAGMHMLFSIAFILLAPFQFSKKIRTKHRRLHRNLGRVLLTFATLSGIYGIAALIALPVFGGLASEAASWFFGPLFLWCIGAGYIHARNKRFTQHREWMIRLYAIGLGVGTQRFVLVLMQTAGEDFYEGFGPALWLGFSINLLIAEVWINRTRRKK